MNIKTNHIIIIALIVLVVFSFTSKNETLAQAKNGMERESREDKLAELRNNADGESDLFVVPVNDPRIGRIENMSDSDFKNLLLGNIEISDSENWLPWFLTKWGKPNGENQPKILNYFWNIRGIDFDDLYNIYSSEELKKQMEEKAKNFGISYKDSVEREVTILLNEGMMKAGYKDHKGITIQYTRYRNFKNPERWL